MTTKNLNVISSNAIFDHVLKTLPTQEAWGAQKKILFETVYNMFDEGEISLLFKEYKPMEDMEVINSVYTYFLTAEQKQKSLREVNLIELKRSRKLKYRMCASGAPHHKFLPREESKLPKITL